MWRVFIRAGKRHQGNAGTEPTDLKFPGRTQLESKHTGTKHENQNARGNRSVHQGAGRKGTTCQR